MYRKIVRQIVCEHRLETFLKTKQGRKFCNAYLKPAQAPSRPDLSLPCSVLKVGKRLGSYAVVRCNVIHEQQEHRSQCKGFVKIAERSEVRAGGIIVEGNNTNHCEDNWQPENANDLALLVRKGVPAEMRDYEAKGHDESDARAGPTND